MKFKFLTAFMTFTFLCACSPKMPDMPEFNEENCTGKKHKYYLKAFEKDPAKHEMFRGGCINYHFTSGSFKPFDNKSF